MDDEIVVFRTFADGDVIALFPCLPAASTDPKFCLSYMRIGQHGAADPTILHDTRPSKPAEYTALKAELERMGYRLAICQRFPAHAQSRRRSYLTC